MKTPYEILNVAPNADDVAIKQAYLECIKLNPPEKAPEQFQMINAAYEQIKTLEKRLKFELFNLPTTNFDSLLNPAMNTSNPPELTPQSLQKIIALTVDSNHYLEHFKTSSH